MAPRIRKRNLIVSYNNLDEQLKELFKEQYPDGYRNHLQRTEKPNGDIIFCAPMETEDTLYMVKFDVKIDSGLVDDDIDKDLYGNDDDDKADEGEFASINEAIDQEEGNSRSVGTLRTGDYADIFTDDDAKKDFVAAAKEFAAELGEETDEEFDTYTDQPDEDDDEEDYNDEPSDEELLDIDENLLPGMLDENGLLVENPVEEPVKRKRGRPRKNPDEPPAPKKPKGTSKRGRPRKNPEE